MRKPKVLFRQEQVSDAAQSLATLVQEKCQPLVFDMTIYIENVIGISSPVASTEVMKALEAPVYKEPLDLALKYEIRAYIQARHYARDVRMAFVKALHYEFSKVSTTSIQHCVLIEVGRLVVNVLHFKVDDWIFIVHPIATPRMDQCFALDL